MPGHLDFETYSEADITVVGAFRYAEDPSTEILIVGFALVDGGPVTTVDMFQDNATELLEPLFQTIRDGVIISAHNSQFERVIWEKVGVPRHGFPVTPKSSQWDCTAARAATISIPRSLDGASTALRLRSTKDPLGMALINKFSKPGKKGIRTWPWDDPIDWQKFIDYCAQDVVVEMALDRILPPLSPYERRIFALDYRINDRGIPIDVELIKQTLAFIEKRSEELVEKAIALTGLRPTQRDKLLGWLQDQGVDLNNLQAAEVERVSEDPDLDPSIRALLKSRIELARAGTKKLKTMLDCVSEDGRVRGAFWYHSATTGRWGSGGVQFHNLSKPDGSMLEITTPEEVLELLSLDGLDLFFDQPLSLIAKSVRGFIRAPAGKEFVIADYAAIEARGLAWISDETWLLDDFRNSVDAYKTMAGKIYGVPYDKIDGALRFFGKQVILGAGYGMGAPRFQGQCAQYGKEIGLPDAKKIIKTYRESVPNIKKFWKTIELAARKCILSGKSVSFARRRLKFTLEKLDNGFEILFLALPSGRRLAYPEPRVEMKEKWGKMMPTIIFKTYYRGMWVDEETYGGKLTENAVQAISRDALADGMLNAELAGYPVFLHVHDETGSEVKPGSVTVSAYEQLICEVRPWAKDFPLTAEGMAVTEYRK